MEKALNAVLFVLACAAGFFLFVFGVRELKAKAHSGSAMRLMLYISIVILALGSFTGCTRKGKAPPAAVSMGDQVNLQAQFNDVMVTLGRGLASKATAKSLAVYETAARDGINRVDQLSQQHVLPAHTSAYLKALFCRLRDEVKRHAENRIMEEGEKAAIYMDMLKLQDSALLELTDLKRHDPFLARLLKDDVKLAFQELGTIPLEVRLRAGALDRNAYRELAGRLQDSLFIYFQRTFGSVALEPTEVPDDRFRNTLKYGVTEKPVPDPVTRCEYGVAPDRRMMLHGGPVSAEEYGVKRHECPPSASALYGVKPIFNPVRHYTALPPGLMVKQPGKAWVSLTDPSCLSACSVIENATEATRHFGLPEGRRVTVESGQILTGWEIQARDPLVEK